MSAFLKAIGEAEGGGYDFKYGAVRGKRNDPWRFSDFSTHPGPGFGGRTTAGREMRLSCAQIVIVASLTGLLAPSMRAEGINGASTSKAPGTGRLRLTVGESFLEARARIARLGWKPIRMHANDNHEYDGAEKRLAEGGFLEVDSCSIDAGANCTLYYAKAAECLRLDTVGEQVNEMTVTRWTAECPSLSKSSP